MAWLNKEGLIVNKILTLLPAIIGLSIDHAPGGGSFDAPLVPTGRDAVSDTEQQRRIEAAKQKRLRKQRRNGGDL
jgi:hypothetical protein